MDGNREAVLTQYLTSGGGDSSGGDNWGFGWAVDEYLAKQDARMGDYTLEKIKAIKNRP